MPSAVKHFLERNRSAGYGRDAHVSLGEFAEKVRQGVGSGAYQFEPWLDRHTEETAEIKQAYRKMLRHPVPKAALLGKINAVSSLDLTMSPASDQQRDAEIAEFCHAAYTSEIDGGLLGIAETILLSGLMDGTSVTERVWNEEPKARGKWKGKRFWKRFKDKEHVRLKVDEFRNVTGVCSTFGTAQEWEPADFIIFRNLQLFQGPGMSDFRAAYAAWWRLTAVEKLRVICLEKFAAGGMMLGTYANEDDRPKLIEAVTAATSRSWAVVPEGVKLELLRMASGSEAEFKSCIDGLKEDIALAISGAFLQMLTSGAGSPDSRGNSMVQRSTSELFIWALATKFTELLNKQATPYLVDENFADADYPTAALGGVNYAEMNQLAGLYKQATDMGAKPSRKAFALATGIQLATDPADELLPPSAQPPAPGGGPPGAGFFREQRITAAEWRGPIRKR